MGDRAAALVGLLGIPALWLLAGVFAWVGVLRHGWRAYQARRDVETIRRSGHNGLLLFAADGTLLAERCRLLLKTGLLAYAWLTLWRLWDRLELTADVWDWRDAAAPLVILMLLLLLTHWSNLDAQRRPPHRGT